MPAIHYLYNHMFHMKLHKILFYIFLVLLPFQTRILYLADRSYVSWYFDYHIAIFLYLTDILLIVCFTSWLIFDRPVFSKSTNVRLIIALIAFIILIILTLFHVKRIDLGIYQVFKWVEFCFVLTYICTTFRDRVDFSTSALILFVSAVFQATLGWIQFHMQHMLGLKLLGEYISPVGTPGLATIDTVAGKVIRAYGTMPQPNILGGFLVLGLIYGLFLVSRDTLLNKFQRLSIAAGIAILLIGVFTTFSRISWAAAVFAIIGFVLFNSIKKHWLPIKVILLACLVSCATIGLLYNSSLQARVNTNDSRSVTDRYFFNDLGLDMVKRFPISGVGIGNYVEAQKDLYKLEPWQHQPPHNIFIFIAAELGLIGLGLFFWMLFVVIKNSWSKNIFSDPLLFTTYILLITFLLMGQFDHYFATIQQGRLMFAVVLGLVAALPNLKEIPNDD